MLINILHRFVRYRFHRLGFQSRFFESNSCRLHYFQRQRRNSTRHLVFVHGLGTSSSTWMNILSSLDSSDTITCVDLPGHGFSKIITGDSFFFLEQFDDTLAQFIHQTQRLPITLIGHSLGGWLAARFAIKNPRSVCHLILINNAGIQYPGIEQQAEAFNIHSVNNVRQLLNRIWYRYPWYFRPFDLSIYRSLQKKQVGRFVASIRDKDFLNKTFSTLTMPVDVIWGKEDRLISKESVEIMKQLLPKVNEHLIPQCGHVPQLERPRELAFILNRILAS